MRFDILTLFPEMFKAILDESIIGRAQAKGVIEINTINIRDFQKINIKRLMIILMVVEMVWLCQCSQFMMHIYR